MNVNIFSAVCITNLHVGNGEVNYNIIDQEVEKDPVTGIPMINSSGVKGAIREFFEAQWGKEDVRIKSYFGGVNGSESLQGSYKFLQMDMLFRPLRVTDDSTNSYILATTKEIVNDFAMKVNLLSSGTKKLEKMEDNEESAKKDPIAIEGESNVAELRTMAGAWKSFADNKVAVVNNLNKYDLPVITRNVLDDNKISKNLWVEEFVPHKSVFGLIILTPDDMDEDFKTILTSKPVQFGGNASIGYGLMDIKEV